MTAIKFVDQYMTRAGPTTSLTLVERIRLGDGHAWRRFVELYYPLVYGWCRRSGLQEHDAADVVQETFLAVTVDTGKISPGPPSRFASWLVARNHAPQAAGFLASTTKARVGAGRDGGLGRDLGRDAGSRTEPSEAPRDELGLLVRRALEWVRGEVHEQTWQAACCVLIQGESVADVARRLRVTPNAVYKAKTRVLRRLRETLAEWELVGGDGDLTVENS